MLQSTANVHYSVDSLNSGHVISLYLSFSLSILFFEIIQYFLLQTKKL